MGDGRCVSSDLYIDEDPFAEFIGESVFLSSEQGPTERATFRAVSTSIVQEFGHQRSSRGFIIASFHLHKA